MQEQSNFDIEAFQDDVLKVVQEIQQDQKVSHVAALETIAGSIAGIMFLTIMPVTLISIFNVWKDKGKKYKNLEQVGKDAEETVKKKDVRKVLCPALQSVSNDVYDIAKVITPILVPLVLAGTIDIPLNPLLFATISLVIARMGISGMCEEYKESRKEKQG